MTDVEAIKQTLARYWQYLDDRREREWVDLFADDASLRYEGTVASTRAELQTGIPSGLWVHYQNGPGFWHQLNSVVFVLVRGRHGYMLEVNSPQVPNCLGCLTSDPKLQQADWKTDSQVEHC